MAVIMAAAVKNKTCREVLSAHTYTTAVTAQHPEGITISNWFLRRIEDKDTGGEVICAKTGYVLQSGNCAVSFGMDKKGREYICVKGRLHGKKNMHGRENICFSCFLSSAASGLVIPRGLRSFFTKTI